MRIGIIGNGAMAAALGAAWAAAGHTLLIGGRAPERARALAARLGTAARAVSPRAAAEESEAVLLAVRWEDAEQALLGAGAADGAFAGRPLIDCTNAVEHGVGALLTAPGEAAAQRIAALAPGARVVKAFHLFPAAQWEPGGVDAGANGADTDASGADAGASGADVGASGADVGACASGADAGASGADAGANDVDAGAVVTVPLAGDPAALELVAGLVRDAGGRPHVVGGLDRARQLEEVAGFVIALAFGGADPAAAVPHVPAANG